MKVAVDLNGGDHGPKVVIAGIKRAINQGFIRPEEIAAIGTPDAIGLMEHPRFVGRHQADKIECDQAVTMGDGPRNILRKDGSSMRVGIQGVADRRFDAFVSAGNTAGMVALGRKILGSIAPGLKPAIAIPLPNLIGPCLLIDAGANPLATAPELVHFGWMGGIYTREVWQVRAPRIGLLNMGSEPSKGDQTLQQAHRLLAELQAHSGLVFAGNVEGDGILTHDINVVVCHGMVGNVILKFGEGIYQALEQKFGFILWIARIVNRFHRKADYQRTGGAPLLGLNGTLIIAHGKSTPKVIANAIRIAVQEVHAKVNEAITREINGAVGPDETSAAICQTKNLET